MSFNYFIEKKKFDEKWLKLADSYEKAGMSEETIKEMYQFDLAVFNSTRKAARHNSNVPMSEDDEFFDVAILLKLCPKAEIANEYDALCSHSRYWWLEEIASPRLTAGIKRLEEDEKELLTLYVYEEHTVEEIATVLGIHHTTVSRRLKKIYSRFKQYP